VQHERRHGISNLVVNTAVLSLPGLDHIMSSTRTHSGNSTSADGGNAPPGNPGDGRGGGCDGPPEEPALDPAVPNNACGLTSSVVQSDVVISYGTTQGIKMYQASTSSILRPITCGYLGLCAFDDHSGMVDKLAHQTV
jgi:hypothetical protein